MSNFRARVAASMAGNTNDAAFEKWWENTGTALMSDPKKLAHSAWVAGYDSSAQQVAPDNEDDVIEEEER